MNDIIVEELRRLVAYSKNFVLCCGMFFGIRLGYGKYPNERRVSELRTGNGFFI